MSQTAGTQPAAAPPINHPTPRPRPSRNAKLSPRYRITRFIAANVILAAFPVIIVVIFRTFSNIPASVTSFPSEFLFLSIVITTTVIGDMCDELKRGGGDEILLYCILGLVVGLMVAISFYATYQYAQIIGDTTIPFRQNMTPWAFILASALGLTSIGIEVMLARV
jgi:hypothetical protein